jgi:hypothetical protein
LFARLFSTRKRTTDLSAVFPVNTFLSFGMIFLFFPSRYD